MEKLNFSGGEMARLKSELRNCKYCNYKKIDVENLGYYCGNRKSEHYLEEIKDDTVMQFCKSGNAKRNRE